MPEILTAGALGFGMFSAAAFELSGEAGGKSFGMRSLGMFCGMVALGCAFAAGAV